MVTQFTIVFKRMTKVSGAITPLHQQIRSKRRELDVKQETLSQDSGLSISYIRRVEKGSFSNIGIETLRKISKALDFYDWDLGFHSAQL